LLTMAPSERAAWCHAFAAAFGPELVLHDAGPRTFLLEGLPALAAQSSDPARLLGCDISQGLPTGPGANALRRLGAEIEMWAHGCELNRERGQRRQPLVSGLWLWGGNGSPLAGRERADRTRSLAFAGDDAFIAGLSRLVTGRDPGGVPLALADFARDVEHSVVELTAMNDTARALARLDTQWFGPARQLLQQRRLGEIRIFANDRIFRVVNLDRMRFWRRRPLWIEALTTRGPKA
jgi:hypothetical protein